MTSWGRQIRFVKFFAVFILTLVILEYIWPVPTTPAKSLRSIIAHRIELRDLETQLDQVLIASNVYDVIHFKNDILAEFDKFLTAIKGCTTDVEDMYRLFSTNELITQKFEEFIAKHQKLHAERVVLKTIAKRVLGVGGNPNSAWILKKNMDIMAEVGVILNCEKEEVDVDDKEENVKSDATENHNLSSKDMEEDDTCFAILQQLLHIMNRVDVPTERMIFEVDPLSAQLNSDGFIPQFGGNNTDPEHKSEIANLLKNKRGLFGKANFFIMAATARVNALLTKVIQKERDMEEEMIQALNKIKEKIIRCSQLLNKLTIKINRRAIVLNRETSYDE